MKRSSLLFIVLTAILSPVWAQKSLYNALNGSPNTTQSSTSAGVSAQAINVIINQTSGSMLTYGAPAFIDVDRWVVAPFAVGVLADLIDQRDRALGNTKKLADTRVANFSAAMQRLTLKGYTTDQYGLNPIPGEFMRFPDYTGAVEIRTEVRFIPPRIYKGDNGTTGGKNQFANAKNAVRTFTFYKK